MAKTLTVRIVDVPEDDRLSRLEAKRNARTLRSLLFALPGNPSVELVQEKDTRYNGWTNYETWLVALWIDNEEGSHTYWRERAQEVWNDARPGQYEWQTRESQAAYTLETELKSHFDEAADDMSGMTGFWSDLLGAALSDVDWREIADGMLSDVDKTENEDEEETENEETE